jgi:protein-S-isoprenylcysteine O-methyltransferase Ste14
VAEATSPRGRLAIAAALILLELGATAAAAEAVLLLLALSTGRQPSPDLPLSLRLAGLGLVVLGLGIGALTFRIRPPKEMLISTSFTLEKLFFRKPLEVAAGRQEPFVVVGPYRYVRNPLYLGVLAMILGLGALLSSVLLLLWCGTLLVWYWFGRSYESYREHVPRLFPFKSGYNPG